MSQRAYVGVDLGGAAGTGKGVEPPGHVVQHGLVGGQRLLGTMHFEQHVPAQLARRQHRPRRDRPSRWSPRDRARSRRSGRPWG